MLAGYNYKNLASITLQNAGLATDNTITIPTFDASILPQTPFYATIMPVTQLANNSNSEIIIATGSTTSGTNTILSVTRAQRNTSAISWNAGEAVLTQAVYVEDIPNYTAGDGINIENEVISFDGGAETVSNTTPSSSFTLNTLSGKPISLSIYGDTYQQTYTGKNLIGFANIASGTGNNVNYTLSNTKVVANGTTTGSSNIIPRSSTGISLPAGTYTVSFNKVSGSYSRPATEATAFYIRTSGGTVLAEVSMTALESGTATPTTITLTETTLIAIQLYANAAGQIFNNLEFTVQIETGSTATSYEPYVGGVPSPNPDYPQAVQVVTGEQTVTITDGASESQSFEINLGKNLFDKNNANVIQGWINATNGAITETTNDRTIYIECQANTTYTITRAATTANNRFRCGTASSLPTTGVAGAVKDIYNPDNGTSSDSNFTYTTNSTASYLVIQIYTTQNTEITWEDMLNTIQIETGSTATSYAEYFTPIELCKIGSYQDYIYKSNGNWYIHKELASRNLSANASTDNWNRDNSSGGRYYANRGATFYGGLGGSSDKLCSHVSNNTSDSPYFLLGNAQFFQFRNGDTTWGTLTAFTNWLTTNTVMAYYPLATATDTQITDATLISQLEAVSLYTGTNAITVSSTNLPALLLITSYANTINGKFRDVVWKGDTTSGVTQLKDQLGENIFPNLKDEQVTSAKIDFTTLLSQKYSFAASDFNASSANVTVLASGTEITIRTNPEKTLFEVYGRFTTTATTVAETSVYIQTDLRPSQTMIITPVGFMTGVDSNGKMNGNFASQTMTIGTDGKMTFRSVNWSDSSSQNRMTSFTFPTLITVE